MGKHTNPGISFDTTAVSRSVRVDMGLFTYVVRRDYGFAPNPFFGVCTLATCMVKIRETAAVGDWIVGTGSKTQDREGQLVYAMKVTETMSFNKYWRDLRFQCKKPNLAGSRKQAFGDNIYRKCSPDGQWRQVNSHHSLPDGRPNRNNIGHDTKVDRVLLSDDFLYFGGSGPTIPGRCEVCTSGIGHRCRFPGAVVRGFCAWLRTLETGFNGPPSDWASMRWTPTHCLT